MRTPRRPRQAALMKLMGSLRTMLGVLGLMSLATIATAAPTDIGPAVDMPGDNALALAALDQFEPVIARGSDGSLAVWTDGRSRLSGQDIYGARLDAEGQCLDRHPIPILLDGGGQLDPQVAWNGTNWLIVVEDESNPVGTEPRLRGVRVSPQGQVLDAEPILIADGGQGGSVCAVSSDGSNWAVFWTGTSAGHGDTRGARISAEGAVLDPGGRVILPETTFVRYFLDAAFAGGRYLLLYNESDRMQGLLLTPSLEPAGPGAITVFADFTAATRVAANGSGFLACASAPGWYIYSRVLAARITPQGQVLDPTPIEVVADAQYGATPHAVFDGTNWIVGWNHPGLRGARVSTAGTVLDPGGVPIDAPNAAFHSAPRLSPASGGGAQWVWGDSRNPFPDVFTARVDGDLIGAPSYGISESAPLQDAPRMAGSGSVTMLVYRSMVAGEARIKATLIDAAGQFATPEPILVAVGDEVLMNEPSVAWDGSRFLVVWSPGGPGQNQVYGRRYLPDGTALDASPIFIMNGLEPDVAGMDGTFLVTGTHGPGYPQYRLVYAVRLQGTDGAVLGAPVAVSDLVGDTYAQRPRVATFEGRWLVTWQGRWSHDNPWARIRANFVAPDGIAGTSFVAADGASAGRHYSYAPAIAVGDGVALITFESTYNGSCCWDLYACRFDAAGSRLDAYEGTLITEAPRPQRSSSVAWDGEQFVVLYQDLRQALSDTDQRPDIYGTRVLSDGTVVDPSGFEVAAGALPEGWPCIMGTGDSGAGEAILAHTVLAPAAPHAAERVVLRRWGAAAAHVDETIASGVPRLFPNPSSARVYLDAPPGDASSAAWGVFDTLGRLRGVFAGGSWDGRDASGRRVAAGVYFARPLQGGPAVQPARLVRQ